VKLGQRVGVLLLRELKHLIELHCVAALLPWLARIRALAKLAINDANVRVINVAVDVVVGDVAVQALAYFIRATANRNDVVRTIELNTLVKRETVNRRHHAHIIHDRSGRAGTAQSTSPAFGLRPGPQRSS